jgi:hypothetical protein
MLAGETCTIDRWAGIGAADWAVDELYVLRTAATAGSAAQLRRRLRRDLREALAVLGLECQAVSRHGPSHS